MARPKLKYTATMCTLVQAAELLEIKPPQLRRRLESKAFPQPTLVDENNTRYFSVLWIREARAALERERDPFAWINQDPTFKQHPNDVRDPTHPSELDSAHQGGPP